MPRIRTIKPEFWDSPGTARATLRGRLFFIALWNWADDYGVGTANPNQLIAFAFPNDDIDARTEFPRLRTEVAECYDVAWYTVDARPFYAIPSWDEHQKNERRAKGKYPGPDQADSPNAETRGTSAFARGTTGTGTGEQGNRGTGEQGKETHSSPNVSTDRAHELSQQELEDVVGVVREELAVDIDLLTAATFAEFILEPATMPVENPVAYIRAALLRSTLRASGLLREAERQVAKVRVAS